MNLNTVKLQTFNLSSLSLFLFKPSLHWFEHGFRVLYFWQFAIVLAPCSSPFFIAIESGRYLLMQPCNGSSKMHTGRTGISRPLAPLKNGFHVAVRLFSDRSQMTSNWVKNRNVAHEAQLSVSVMYLLHLDVICSLLRCGNMESICFRR